MVGIERDDRLLVKPQARPRALDLDLGDQQLLPVLVDAPLAHPHDPSQGVLVAIAGARLEHIEQRDPLAQERLAPVAVLLGVGQPLLGTFLVWIPLDQIVDGGGLRVLLVVRLDHGDVLDGVVAPVKAQQQGRGGQLPGTPQHASEKRGRALLAVLAAGTHLQFQFQAVALPGRANASEPWGLLPDTARGKISNLLKLVKVSEGCLTGSKNNRWWRISVSSRTRATPPRCGTSYWIS